MTRIRWTGLVSLFALLGGLVGPFPLAQAEDELEIGIPDFPRRIQKQLPELKPDQELEIGILKLHPYFKTQVEYDDNIRLSESDEREDVIFIQTPAGSFEMDLGNHRFQAGYGMEIVNFVKDQEENAVNHLANALLELNFNDFQVTVQDVLERSTSRLFSETSVRDRLLINTVEVLGRYDRPRWASEVGWRHNTIDHKTDVLNNKDYEEDVIVALAGYKILPKTLLLVETDLGSVVYKKTGNANQDYWQVLGGVRGEPREDFSVTAKLGFQARKLGDVPGLGPGDDFNGLVANIDMLYNLNDSDSLRLNYLRTVRTSTFADNSWYRQDSISLSYAKSIFSQWVARPKISWQFNDYPEMATAGGSTKRRDDHFWIASFELRYKIQEWLSTGIIYRFRARNSNMDTFDFDNNRFSFDVTLAY